MRRPLAVLRPQPGNEATAARIEARGLSAIRLPLFDVGPLDWTAPDPASFDALILTSANGVRHGGPGLAAVHTLPVYAVGAATARAATAVGFDVKASGTSDAEALIEQAAAAGVRRALHLCGREARVAPGGIIAQSIAVYASETLTPLPADLARLPGAVALLHSPRAGAHLGTLIDGAGIDRATIAIAAISLAAAAAAGPGWHRIATAAAPNDAALIDGAARLAD